MKGIGPTSLSCSHLHLEQLRGPLAADFVQFCRADLKPRQKMKVSKFTSGIQRNAFGQSEYFWPWLIFKRSIEFALSSLPGSGSIGPFMIFKISYTARLAFIRLQLFNIAFQYIKVTVQLNIEFSKEVNLQKRNLQESKINEFGEDQTVLLAVSKIKTSLFYRNQELFE